MNLLFKCDQLFIHIASISLWTSAKKHESTPAHLPIMDANELTVNQMTNDVIGCEGLTSVAQRELWMFTMALDPARALATDSFSFSAAFLCTTWKLLRAAEKSFIRRSFWSFCCLCKKEEKINKNYLIFFTMLLLNGAK